MSETLCASQVGTNQRCLETVFPYRIMQIVCGGKLSRFSWISLQPQRFSSDFFLSIIRCFELLYNCESFPANNKKIMQPRNFSTVNDLHYMVPQGNKSRQYLPRHGLLGKITLASDMTEVQIFKEVSSVFNDSFGSRENFRFLILQPTGEFSKSLTILRISSQYKWSASSVAGKNAKVPIYILAQEPLKVCSYVVMLMLFLNPYNQLHGFNDSVYFIIIIIMF